MKIGEEKFRQIVTILSFFQFQMKEDRSNSLAARFFGPQTEIFFSFFFFLSFQSSEMEARKMKPQLRHGVNKKS